MTGRANLFFAVPGGPLASLLHAQARIVPRQLTIRESCNQTCSEWIRAAASFGLRRHVLPASPDFLFQQLFLPGNDGENVL